MVDGTALATISSLLVSLKALVGMAKDVNDVEFNGKVIEIQQKVLDLQAKFAELQSENEVVRRENQELKDASDLAKRVIFHDHAQWNRNDDGSEDGPFCPSCWTDGLLHRGQVMEVDKGVVEFCCKRHKNFHHYYVPEHLVKVGDLSIFRAHHSYSPPSGGAGPHGWMR
jgi:hypothetical protein